MGRLEDQILSGKNNEGIWESHPTILAAGDTDGMDQWAPGHRGYQALIATPLVSCLICHLREFLCYSCKSPRLNGTVWLK